MFHCCVSAAAEMYGDSPMEDPDTHDALKQKLTAVYGFCIDSTFASQPAAVPGECPANTCPTQGLWGLNTIRAPAVWASLPGTVNENPTACVMVVDGGVRATHADLAANLVPDLLLTGYGGVVQQPPAARGPAFTSHGTHVSGTVFARWSNGQGTPVGVVGRALAATAAVVSKIQTAELVLP
jgi:subtilisin family serine protease